MSFLKKSCAWLLAGSLIGVGPLMFGNAAIAQSGDIDPLEGLGTDDDGADAFGGSNSPFELIHRAILAPSMSGEEFFQYQNQLLTDEASDFRQRQQEALRQQTTPESELTDEVTDEEVL